MFNSVRSMDNSLPIKVLRLLFQRRRRRIGAFIAWLFAYTATALLYGIDMEAEPRQMLPFLIPLAIALAQMIYPTLFVWALIVIPSVFYTGIGLYYLARDLADKQWEYDMQGLVLGSIAITIYIAVCAGLIWSRPKRVQAVNAMQEPTATAT